MLLQITGFTVITQIFHTEMMKYIGYLEITIGLGLGLGPTIGSIVYKYLSYEHTMYFFGGLNLIGLVICYFLIPSVLNNRISI